MKKEGQLTCVGLGMTLGAHLTPASKNFIKNADVVFVAASNALVEIWVQKMNTNVVSLQPFYAAGKSRKQTYKDMVEVMLSEVRQGKTVCGAFYGHPGVFALAPHKVIKMARKEGYKAHMEPGISAESCLYADLGLDPGRTGCQHFETNQYMYYERVIDTAALLVLWQVGLAGDKLSDQFSTNKAALKQLVGKLLKHYPAEHKVYIYEAKLLAIDEVRAEEISLRELVDSELNMNSTLVLPPITRLIDIKAQYSVE